MSPNKRKHPKHTEPESNLHQDNPAYNQDDVDPQNILSCKKQTVQISSAQAQLYFEYLRKKISHQTNDPFSLPFLKFKFEQLDSWKGATQQLNLESKIYGLRVDNCHDNTIKMLNYVIRNQQDQIGKDTGGAQKQAKKEDEIHANQQQKSNPNFYLQKPQKICANVESAIHLENVSFWRTVFKKSQTLSQIQLNTIELSSNLALEVDLKNLNYKSVKSDTNHSLKSTELQIQDNLFEIFPYFNQKLEIFKEIELIKKQVNEEIQQILQKRKNKRQSNGQDSMQNPLWEMNLGMRDLDFTDFYQEFNQFQRNQEEEAGVNENQIFTAQFEEEERHKIFTPNLRQLKSIQIDFMDQNRSEYSQANDEQHFESDLYQPQKDILFKSSYKKAKKIDTRNFGKIRRTYNTNIDFSNTSLIMDKKKVFKHKKYRQTNLKNNNLIPISYVVVFESRNPFKKLKKVPKNHTKTNIYDSNNLFQCFQTQQMTKPFDRIQETMNLSSYPQINTHEENNTFESSEEIEETSKYMKNIPMKTVKQEIIRQMKNCDRNMMLSRPLSMNHWQESYNLDRTSYLDTYLEEEACLIGLKFFKHKMKTYDPLDLLVSLLHVAFQEQVILHPVYSSRSGEGTQDNLILQDILIQGDQLL